MISLPAITLPLKLLAAKFPTPRILQLDRVLGDSLRTLCGTTMTMSSLADLYQGQKYAAALGFLQTATGVGLVLGPQLSKLLMGTGGQRPRLCFLAAAALAALHLALAQRYLEETNEKLADKVDASPAREPSGSILANISGMLGIQDYRDSVALARQLWRRGGALRQRAMLFVLHCFVEGKVIQDQVLAVQMMGPKEMGLEHWQAWQAGRRDNWSSAHGAVLSAGSFCGPLVRRVGDEKFLLACHLASLGAFLWFKRIAEERARGDGGAEELAKDSHGGTAMNGQRLWLWSGLLPLLLGSQRRLISASWLLQEGLKGGLQRGQVVGLMATLRAFSEVCASWLFSNSFKLIKRRQWLPAQVFYVPTVLIALAEMSRQRFALRAETTRELLGTDASYWTVTLNRPCDQRLGLDLDLLDPAVLQICQVHADSVVDRYNQTAAPERRIQAGDLIVKVNRASGQASDMADLLQSPQQTLTLLLQRPPWRTLSLSDAEVEELRSAFTSMPQSVSLYSTLTIPSIGLRRHDRLMAVDGALGDLQGAWRSALKGGKPFEVSILRCGPDET
ncbi:Polyubiquitin [Durusdinium trenchii]|uniref:Polyubiquitin n=1 Tax=Durusdinium trenchii TaxID=1381693 RepID=A0ABP0SA28_9DINO